ncbi:DNA-binding response regulator [Opitutaceae bacterium EW11]|nr:DNA-binding response regulator [Opitutaceae bacterium EW11]
MNAVIVDDERLAREELRALLNGFDDVKIVGEAANATEAIALLAEVTADVLFLDIEMPGCTGFELLSALPRSPREVVFVTAYDEFALRAFSVNAVDYLLKPVKPLRLADTIKRLRERLRFPEGDEPAGEEGPVNNAPLREDDQFFVREGDRCWFIPVRSLILMEADGGHTRVHFPDGKPLVHRTLAALEERLPKSLFLRANRGQVVNRLYIQSMEPWFSGSLKVKLKNGLEVEFSRRQAQALRENLGL